MAASLTSQIAVEDGEAATFAQLVEAQALVIKHPDKVFLAARTKYLSGDPRLHTLAGEALGVDGTWPTPKLLAAVCWEQFDLGGTPTAYAAPAVLKNILDTKRRPDLHAENEDLFGPISGRAATQGALPEKAGMRALYRSHSEPFLGMGWVPGSGVNDESGHASRVRSNSCFNE